MSPRRLALLLSFALVPAAASAQPADNDGLPGRPVLPSESRLAADDSADDSADEAEPSRMSRAGAAVADYLTRSFIEDAGVTADGWLSWGKPSDSSMPVDHSRRIRVRIKTKKLEAEFDETFNRTDGVENAERKEKLAFKDMIGKSIVEVSFDGARERRPDGTDLTRRNDAHALGWVFNEDNTLRFEMTLKREDATSLYRNSYRAVLETTGPFENTPASETGRYERTKIRIGIERTYNVTGFGDGETNAVLGLDNTIGRTWGKRYLRIHTTVELLGGSRDERSPGAVNPVTLGASGRLGIEFGGARWSSSVTGYSNTRHNGVSFDHGEFDSANETREYGIKFEGSWRFSEGRHKLFTTLDSSFMRTRLNGIDAERVWRNTGEIGVEFNDRWRVGLNGSYKDYGTENDWTVGFTIGFKFGR